MALYVYGCYALFCIIRNDEVLKALVVTQNISRTNAPEEISLLTATPPPHPPAPSTSAQQKNFEP
jgi:hypothetical protein